MLIAQASMKRNVLLGVLWLATAMAYADTLEER